jgi:uncharacterized protein (TIGR02722 family)
MTKVVFIQLFVSLMLILGCGPSVERVDPTATDETTVQWDMKDIELITQKMLASLGNHRLAHKEPPTVMLVLTVKNKTYEKIDTKAITETIVTHLLQLGKFRVLAEKDMRAVLEQEVEHKKSETGSTTPGTDTGDGEIFSIENIKKKKAKVGTDVVMYGEISGIEKRRGNLKDISYKMTLKLVDIETTLVEWQDQKDIRKKGKGGSFGW